VESILRSDRRSWTGLGLSRIDPPRRGSRGVTNERHETMRRRMEPVALSLEHPRDAGTGTKKFGTGDGKELGFQRIESLPLRLSFREGWGPLGHVFSFSGRRVRISSIPLWGGGFFLFVGRMTGQDGGDELLSFFFSMSLAAPIPLLLLLERRRLCDDCFYHYCAYYYTPYSNRRAGVFV
jgi:hypothetical protein